jgi:hypothetical protein
MHRYYIPVLPVAFAIGVGLGVEPTVDEAERAAFFEWVALNCDCLVI